MTVGYADVTVTLPQAEVQKLEALLGTASPRFIAICEKAVKSGTRAMRAAMIRRAADTLGIGRGPVLAHVWANRVRSNAIVGVATAGRWGWSLKSLGLDENAYEVEGLGVTVDLPSGTARRYPKAFVLNEARGRNSGALTGAFERVPGVKRLPIRRVFIEGPAAALAAAAAEPAVREIGLNVAMRTMTRERDKLLTGGSN